MSSREQKCVLAICISSGEVERIADGFEWPQGLALSESNRAAYVADSELNQIITIDLPARFFR